MTANRLQCSVARQCGGCALIGRPYAEQLAYKARRVKDAFASDSRLVRVVIEECVGAASRRAYRNRAKLAVAHDGSAVRVGLFGRGGHRVVDLAPCVVQRPVLQEGIERLRVWLERHRLARPRGPVIYADLRESAGELCHLTLVLDGAGVQPDALPLEELAQEWPVLSGIAVNFGDAGSSYAFGPVTRGVLGADTILATLPSAGGGELQFEVPPAGFFQVAGALLGVVHDRMAEHLGRGGTLHDLYCGVGVHGLVLGQRGACGRVIGVEGAVRLVRAAERNAERMGVPARYVAGPVERVLPGLPPGETLERGIVNPGRAGCRPEVIDTLLHCGARKLAYLSCNVTTLARDLSRLARGGFHIGHVVPFDLMPQTDHVEVLALLDRPT